jgi:hypothetical protein
VFNKDVKVPRSQGGAHGQQGGACWYLFFQQGTTLYNTGRPFILGGIIFADFGNINGKERAFVLEAQNPQYYLQLELGRKVCMSIDTAFLAPILTPCKQNDIDHDFNDPFAEAWREITLGNIPCGL